MSQLGFSKRPCCWMESTPGNNESACLHLHAGAYLEPALKQVAHTAFKVNSSLYYKLKYELIAKHRGEKRAIIAIARIILTAVFQFFALVKFKTG